MSVAVLFSSLITLTPTYAAEYPERPIRVIVATSAGGVSDVFIRALGEELRKKLGQPLVVDNRPGGAFNIAAKGCAQAAPDGYTVCVMPGEALSYNRFLFKNPGYDAERDFVPVTNLFFITQVLAVKSGLDIKDLDSLASVSKQKTGTMSYSAPGLSHALFVEDFKRKSGADLVRVPFRGGGDAVNALVSGVTPVLFLGLGNLVGQLDAGVAVPVLVDGEARSPLLPKVLTIREAGYSGDLTRSYFGLVAPASTPDDIIQRVQKEIAAVMRDDDFVRKNLIERALEPAVSSSAEFAKFLREDAAASERVTKASGLQPQ